MNMSAVGPARLKTTLLRSQKRKLEDLSENYTKSV